LSEGEVYDDVDIASGYKYAYIVEDENTIQKIYNPQNREEYKFSVPALRRLKDWVDERYSRTEFDAQGNIVEQNDEARTALEGFIIYMAAPDFSAGKNVDTAKTIGTERMMQYKDLPEGEVTSLGTSVVAKRETFVVVHKQISIPRMLAANRYYENKRTGEQRIIGTPWRPIREGLLSLNDAVNAMKAIITDVGQIVEDETGTIVEKDPLPRLSPTSTGVAKADLAFQQFLQNQRTQQPQQPQQPQAQNVEDEVEPNADDDGNKTANLIKSILRRYN
jgi:hypothetical protein